MRLAVLSDVHGNIEALDAILTALKAYSPDRYACLGDIVGYGASPNECCERIREQCELVVIGNHDRGVFDLKERTFMNQLAVAGVEYATETLEENHVEYLKSLPFTQTIGSDVMLSHGLPSKPEDWLYSDDANEVAKTFVNINQKIVFVGHLHVPHGFVFDETNGRLRAHVDEEVDVSSLRHLINVGSVGQPRDEDPRTAAAILDMDTLKVTLIRVEYNISAAAKKIIDAGLPEMLAQRITIGR